MISTNEIVINNIEITYKQRQHYLVSKVELDFHIHLPLEHHIEINSDFFHSVRISVQEYALRKDLYTVYREVDLS